MLSVISPHAIRSADHLAIGQNKEVNARSKRNTALSTFEIAGHSLRSCDAHLLQEMRVLIRKLWL